MDFIVPSALCLPAIIISALLLLDSSSTLTSGIVEIKQIRSIMAMGLIQAIAYFIEYILYEQQFFESRLLAMVIESCLYLCNLLVIYSFSDMIYAKYQSRLQKVKISRFLFLFSLMILALLDVANMFVPVFFDITPDTFEYVETPLVAIVNIIPLLAFFFSAFNDVREMRYNTHYFNLPISLYYSLAAAGILVESLFFDVPIIPVCCAVSISLLYIRILKRVGYIDHLSGLYTRSSLAIYIDSQLSKLASDEMLIGIMMDVNHFKEINDGYGHVVGDRAISAMGEILKSVTRKKGLGFRYGGDEFIIIFKANNTAQMEEMVQDIELALDKFNQEKTEVFSLSVSIGCSIYQSKNASIVNFIDEMDAEIYKKKRSSKAEQKKEQIRLLS